jgi:hypothetical protein
MDDEHFAVNRAWWDERAPAHVTSPDYAVPELLADPTRLSDHGSATSTDSAEFICNAISARTRSHCSASVPE